MQQHGEEAAAPTQIEHGGADREPHVPREGAEASAGSSRGNSNHSKHGGLTWQALNMSTRPLREVQTYGSTPWSSYLVISEATLVTPESKHEDMPPESKHEDIATALFPRGRRTVGRDRPAKHSGEMSSPVRVRN